MIPVFFSQLSHRASIAFHELSSCKKKATEQLKWEKETSLNRKTILNLQNLRF